MKLGKKKQQGMAQLFGDVLNLHHEAVFIVRWNDCRMVFINQGARALMGIEDDEPINCKEAVEAFLPKLCEQCKKLGGPTGSEQAQIQEEPEWPAYFDVTGKKDILYGVSYRPVTWVDGEMCTAFHITDVNEKQRVQDRLYSLAYIDQLTGMPNRQKFKEDFEAVSSLISTGKLEGIVSIFDLDNFKAVNDTYGHNTGDIMLRRIAERLNNEEAFCGHLYRLGGDEFVFFFTELKGRHLTFQVLKQHYTELLRTAQVSYTLPNIETSCTLSMGVAFFPQHGSTTSELLRKADIALYKSKTEGRDRCTIFEEQYDRAKKFKDLYINMQPILTGRRQTFGYEMIDRGNEGLKDQRSVNLTDYDRTLDALSFDDMQSEARYFISYNSNLQNESVRSNLPKEKFIIQINLPPVVKEKELEAYAKLKSYGYSLAMNGLTSSNATEALIQLMDYGKFFPGGMNEMMRDRLISRHPDKSFIALNVDTYQQFEDARRRGFKLFQGFFFNKSVITKKTKEIDPLKVNYYRLLKLSSAVGPMDFKEISAIISVDVALSYKLLTLLNSAALGLRHRITSIEMAVAYLGEEKLKQWIALLALRGAASDKPLELLRMCLIRAQFGEILAPYLKPRRDSRHVFMIGMFSLLHVALDRTKEELMNELPVSEDIRDSILTRNGPFSELLQFFSNFEYANWDEITRFADEHQITCQFINNAYISAVKWYNDLVEQ